MAQKNGIILHDKKTLILLCSGSTGAAQRAFYQPFWGDALFLRASSYKSPLKRCTKNIIQIHGLQRLPGVRGGERREEEECIVCAGCRSQVSCRLMNAPSTLAPPCNCLRKRWGSETNLFQRQQSLNYWVSKYKTVSGRQKIQTVIYWWQGF